MNNNAKNKMSSNDRNKYIESKEKEAVSLSRSVKEAIPDIFECKRYREVLGLFDLFHRYSYINIVLIYLQFPTATYLAGFNTWQNISYSTWQDTSRQILKEEYKGKKISLIAPYTHVEWPDRRLLNFVVPVYDILQTNNLPPLEQPPEYISDPKTKNLLSAIRHHSPYRIVIAGRENELINRGMTGYCDFDAKLIILDEKLKGKRLLAETIRAVVTAEIDPSITHHREYSDLIIESVVYILNRHFGQCMDSETNNLLFVSRYKANPVDELAASLNLIQLTSHRLIEKIESFLSEIEEYERFSWISEDAFLDFDY